MQTRVNEGCSEKRCGIEQSASGHGQSGLSPCAVFIRKRAQVDQTGVISSGVRIGFGSAGSGGGSQCAQRKQNGRFISRASGFAGRGADSWRARGHFFLLRSGHLRAE